MEIKFKTEALLDRDYWKKSGNLKAQAKISKLLKEIAATPFSGTGKPEPLKGDLSGYWSRRIARGHRLVYAVENNIVTVHSMRGHYRKNL